MKRRKQILALLLTGIMCIPAMLTGCGNKEAANSGKTEVSSQESQSKGTENTQSEDRTLTVALQARTNITDYEDNYLTKYLEDKLDIDLDLVLIPRDDYATKLALMLTAQENIPDVMLFDGDFSDQTIYQYGKNGIFLNLTDYVNDPSAMPNFNNIPEEDKELMLSASTQVDGNVYSCPSFGPSSYNATPYRYFINQAWLDKLNLPMPTTTEELKEVLIAFRDNDPNGNGIKDEIPVYGAQNGYYGVNTLVALMNSFVFYGADVANSSLTLSDDGSKVIAPYTTEGWKKGLLYMKELYDEGLISPGVFTDDQTQLKATLNLEPNIVGLVTSGDFNNWQDAANNANFAEMKFIAPFTGPDGICYTPCGAYVPNQCVAVSATTTKADLAIKFVDEFYDITTYYISRYGEEGVHWTRDREVLDGISHPFMNVPGYEKVYIGVLNPTWGKNNNANWAASHHFYRPRDFVEVDLSSGKEYTPESPEHIWGENEILYSDKHPEYLLPKLKYTEEEMEKILDIPGNVNTYIRQAMAEFIIGSRDIEKGWDAYLNDLENMGLSTWIEVSQTAYDRVK